MMSEPAMSSSSSPSEVGRRTRIDSEREPTSDGADRHRESKAHDHDKQENQEEAATLFAAGDESETKAPDAAPESNNKKGKRAICRNHNRGMIFRKWLLETFADSVFNQSNRDNDDSKKKKKIHILDVAGGKGDVAIPLVLAGFRTTIIDPRICDLSRNSIVKNLQYHLKMKNTKTYAALRDKLGEDALNSKGLPMPEELREYFTARGITEDDDDDGRVVVPATRNNCSNCDDDDDDDASGSTKRTETTSTSAATESPAMIAAKRSATLIVGMHADEATEPIVDFALKQNLQFAVVPCCVFPRDNPHRKHPHTGKHVQTYEDFVAYLCAKDPKIELAKLECDGRNLVVFRR